MEDMQILIEQMVVDIGSQAFQLEEARLHLFLDWLSHHSSRLQINAQVYLNDPDQEQFKTNLNAWFRSLPLNGLLWEYRLLLDEVAWWRALDPTTLILLTKGNHD